MPPGKIKEKAGLRIPPGKSKKEELVSSKTRQKSQSKFENLTHKGSQKALSKIFNTIPTCVP
jgi:hypothetical protein